MSDRMYPRWWECRLVRREQKIAFVKWSRRVFAGEETQGKEEPASEEWLENTSEPFPLTEISACKVENAPLLIVEDLSCIPPRALHPAR